MKRMIMLAVLCAFVLGTAVSASAADIKATGAFAIEALWQDNMDFQDTRDNDNTQDFNVYERARVQFEFIANENLKAVLYTEYGTATWGVGAMEVGTSAVAIEVKDAYVDFNWPGTDVNIKAGYQAVNLPDAVTGGSFILNEDIAAALVSGAINDNVSYLVGYARATQGSETTSTTAANTVTGAITTTTANNSASTDAQIDAYVAALPLTFDGITVVPFGVLANTGRNANAGTVPGGLASRNAAGSEIYGAYWLGAAMTLDMFDPIVVKADLNYGSVAAANDQDDLSGWVFDLSVAYTGLDFMTPEVFFVYMTGEDDDNTNGSEVMPSIAADWAVGSFFFGGDALLNGSDPQRNNARGLWTLGLSLKDISFLEGLTHTINVLYIAGTNSSDNITGLSYGRSLTTKDHVWELDFNSAYKIYDELTAYVELGWMAADYDTDVWGAGVDGGNAVKVSVGAAYVF